MPEAIEVISSRVGICQRRRPELHASGGVHKPRLPRAGLRGTPVYRFRRTSLRLFLFWYTRLRYRILARPVVLEIER